MSVINLLEPKWYELTILRPMHVVHERNRQLFYAQAWVAMLLVNAEMDLRRLAFDALVDDMRRCVVIPPHVWARWKPQYEAWKRRQK